MRSLLLIGGGGHCRSCIDVIEASGTHMVAGYVDPNGSKESTNLGYSWLGDDHDLPQLIQRYKEVLITVGQVKSPDIRIELFTRLKAMGAVSPVLVSANAYVSRHAEILAGTIVMHGAVINASAYIAENSIINSQALVEHDVMVESHCHISTGAKLNGNVHIEAGSFIGSGAVIRHGVRIGERCVVGAGAVVLKDLPAGTIFKGKQ